MELSTRQRYLSYAVFVERILDKFDACEEFGGVQNNFCYLQPFGGLDTIMLLNLICEGKFDEAIELVNEDERANEENEQNLTEEEMLKPDEKLYCSMAYDMLTSVIELMK